MIVRKAFKYRIYSNREHQEKLAVQFGHARYIDNWGWPKVVTAIPDTFIWQINGRYEGMRIK